MASHTELDAGPARVGTDGRRAGVVFDRALRRNGMSGRDPTEAFRAIRGPENR